jgi:hypothetical protein
MTLTGRPNGGRMFFSEKPVSTFPERALARDKRARAHPVPFERDAL